MSANEQPPETIYLQIGHEAESWPDHVDGVTWCTDKINDNDIEYTKATEITRLTKIVEAGEELVKVARNGTWKQFVKAKQAYNQAKEK